MLDIGISKILIIGAVALIVIGPQQLPSTAKAIGILWGRLNRYINKLKQEVNTHVNLEELHNLSQQAIQSGNEISQSISENLNFNADNLTQNNEDDEYFPRIRNGRYSWRLKQHSMPIWYKRSHKIKLQLQNGASRMKRFRYRKNSKQYFWF